MKFIELRNVYKVYKNGVTAITNMNLEIKKGDFVFVIGPTACGKSTFIKMLYREERPTRGEVYVGGINVAKLKNNKVYKLRRKIGIVFQDYKLLPKLTAYENVAFVLESYGYKESDQIDIIFRYFADHVHETAGDCSWEGGTHAFPEVLQEIKKLNAENVIIMTDNDFDRMTNWSRCKKVVIEGCVWWLWRNRKASQATKYLEGLSGTFEYWLN